MLSELQGEKSYVLLFQVIYFINLLSQTEMPPRAHLISFFLVLGTTMLTTAYIGYSFLYFNCSFNISFMKHLTNLISTEISSLFDLFRRC